MKKIVLLLPFVLIACTAPIPTAESELPDRVVYRTQGYYNAAVALENAYGNLPRCGKPASPVICSDLAIMKKIRKVDDIAYAAITEARGAVRTPGFAQSKITTFVTSATALTKAFSDIAETLPH